MNDYVSGGYYLARFAERHDYMSQDLIPERVLSASSEICKFFPDAWAIEWSNDNAEERSEKAAEFGISQSSLPKVVAWATKSFGKAFGWPSSFYTLEAAREAHTAFIPQGRDIVLFGLGLHESKTVEFLDAARPSPQKPGFAPEGESGVFQCISKRERMAAGGDVVGFEPVATLYGALSGSWLHYGLEKDCIEELGIAPNRRGFIESYQDALRCVELISQIKERGRWNPGLWLPWLIAVYDLAD